jgi:arsenate reductase
LRRDSRLFKPERTGDSFSLPRRNEEMMNPRPMTVLFLSTGNAARSLLAEALLRAKGGVRFTARSAGYRPLAEAHPQTLALLQAEGLPVEGLHAKSWGEFLASAHLMKIDVIVTLSEEARENCPVWPGSGVTSPRDMLGMEASSSLMREVTPRPVRVHWPVDDPLAADKADVREWKFRKCFATLENRITSLVRNRVAQSPAELLLQLKDIAMVV